MACFLSWSHSQLLSGALSLEHCNWEAGCQQEWGAGTRCRAPGASLKDLSTCRHQGGELPSTPTSAQVPLPCRTGTKTFLKCHTKHFQHHQQILSAPEPPKISQSPPGCSHHIPAPSHWKGGEGSCEMRCLCCHCDLTTSKWVSGPVFSASLWLHTTTLAGLGMLAAPPVPSLPQGHFRGKEPSPVIWEAGYRADYPGK